MSILSNLKLTTAKRTTQITPVMYRRNKLSKRIAEQIELAKAKQDGKTYAPTKQCKVIDEETGNRVTVQVEKRVKPWWFNTDSGKLCIALRYGAKIISLNAKGAIAVEIANNSDLVATLETLNKAVQSGELDAQLEAASEKVKTAFKK